MTENNKKVKTGDNKNPPVPEDEPQGGDLDSPLIMPPTPHQHLTNTPTNPPTNTLTKKADKKPQPATKTPSKTATSQPNIVLGELHNKDQDGSHYKFFSRNQDQFKVGDDVMVEFKDDKVVPVGVRKIVGIRTAPAIGGGCSKLLRLQKYFWPEDTCTARQKNHQENEVFISDLLEEVNLQSERVVVQRKVVVVEIGLDLTRKGPENGADTGVEEFVCRQKYDPSLAKFIPLNLIVECID